MSNVKFARWKTACAVCVLGSAAAIALPAQTFTTLLSFNGTDGSHPMGGLVQGTDGNLYGTASESGADTNTCEDLGVTGCGTVFRITPSGRLTTLYSFCSQVGCADGAFPAASLVQATNGNFYGTTVLGGANDTCDGGCGTVFKITTGGTLTTLHSFDMTDGYGPASVLVQGTDGNLYGTTDYGGANGSCANGCGTVFKITEGGVLTTLHSFDGTDGYYPRAALIQATDGNLYGTTLAGGTSDTGTIFEITASGTLTTIYNFCSESGCTDGNGPAAALIQASGGYFYGTTEAGGADDLGTVFEISQSGTLTTLHSFEGSAGSGGNYPEAALIQATDGILYGTATEGGSHNAGTAFKITSGGTLTTLYNFCSDGKCDDGSYPSGALVQATNGTFYGMTVVGGVSGACTGGDPSRCGTVFSLSVGLGPFVEVQPTFGKVGAIIKILGTSLTGAMSVSFNGTAATFTVVSPSLITTTVPAGATTGNVDVTTPGGALSSNVPFRVGQ